MRRRLWILACASAACAAACCAQPAPPKKSAFDTVIKQATGRNGYGTPNGTFHPQSMMRSYFSRKYYNAPMPHAIFFYYGFAIHGTNNISQLGGPASHGCVRLHPSNAATLFSLVQRSGAHNTTIHISN